MHSKYPKEVHDLISSNLGRTASYLRNIIKKETGIDVPASSISNLKTRDNFIHKKKKGEQLVAGYIKVVQKDGKTKLKHHIVWEKYHKPIDKKREMLIFLDGDKTNCSIKNLMLIERKYAGSANQILFGIANATPKMKKLAIAAAMLKNKALILDVKEKGKKRKIEIREPEKKKILLDMIKKGKSITEMAKKTGYSRSSICYLKKRSLAGYYDNL